MSWLSIGKRFGKLVVIAFLGRRDNGKDYWACQCDCGGLVATQRGSLRTGGAQSCGCLSRHGKSHTPEHHAWAMMKGRCLNPNATGFHRYGGRGIKVCDRWTGPGGFKNFFADMGPRPTRKHSLDRIDVNGNYEPSNCRWASPTEQQSNKRTTHYLTYKGETKSVARWAEELGMNRNSLYNRVSTLGWSDERAIEAPLGHLR